MSSLERLFRAIAAGDRALSSKLLAATPALATDAARFGATRQDESPFLAAIGLHVYAGETALHVASAAHDPIMVRQLLALGADPMAINRRKATPLHRASVGNPDSSRWDPSAQAETIGLLIDAGAHANAADMDGATPLHRAVRTRCSAAVNALIAHGAEVEKTNRSGSTPLRLALHTTGRGGSGSPSARLEQAEIIRLLLAHGARPLSS